MENPMVSQLLEEVPKNLTIIITFVPYYKSDKTNCTQASQNLRQTPTSQPLLDSAYIISILPPTRRTTLTTTTKARRASRKNTATPRQKIVKKNTDTPNKKAVKAKKGQSGE
jgi:hypothetical protein